MTDLSGLLNEGIFKIHSLNLNKDSEYRSINNDSETIY